jgi:hypothetical protein
MYSSRIPHCVQGATILRLGLDLTSAVFSHGQLYVAVSRVRHRSHMRLLGVAPQAGERAVLWNVVYRSLLDPVAHPLADDDPRLRRRAGLALFLDNDADFRDAAFDRELLAYLCCSHRYSRLVRSSLRR